MLAAGRFPRGNVRDVKGLSAVQTMWSPFTRDQTSHFSPKPWSRVSVLTILGYTYLNDVASNKTSTVLPANSRLTQFSSNVHVQEILFEVGPRDELLLACPVNEAVRAPPRQHQRRLKETVLWSPSYLCGRYVMEHINQPYKTHLFCRNTREIFLRSWYNTGSASPGKKVNFYFIGIVTIIAHFIYISFFVGN